MPDLLETSPPSNVRSGVEPGATPRGTAIPIHVDRFGISNISLSTLYWEDPHTLNIGLILVSPFTEVTLGM